MIKKLLIRLLFADIASKINMGEGTVDLSDIVEKEEIKIRQIKLGFMDRWRKFEKKNFVMGVTPIDRKFYEKVMKFVDKEIIKQKQKRRDDE